MYSHHPVIHIRKHGKKYQLGVTQQLYHSLRDAIVNTLKAPFKIFYQAPPDWEFWVLKFGSINDDKEGLWELSEGIFQGGRGCLRFFQRLPHQQDGTMKLNGQVRSLLEARIRYP